MCLRILALLGLATVMLAATSVAGAHAVEDASCRPSEARTDSLAALGPRGELMMSSGQRVVLSGIHWPETSQEAADAALWIEQQRDRFLTIVTRGSADRWGRHQADIAHRDAPSLDFAAELIDAGLTQVDAGERDVLCRPDLLAREEPPRMAGGGIWGKAPSDARDGSAFAALAGRFVVAEGTILHVGERGRRTYLDFVPRGGNGLSVTVPKRTWRIMSGRGLTKATLLGRFVRVRGRVEIWRGPILDIVSADMIEVPEGERAQQR